MKTKAAVAAAVVLALGLGFGLGMTMRPVVAPEEPSMGETVEPAADRQPPASVEVASTTRDMASAQAASDAPAAARPRRSDSGAAYSLDDVRRVVREELARRDSGDAEPEAPAPANADLNADPARRSAVAESLAGARKTFIEYDLRYSLGPGHVLAPPDPVRLESYPAESSWPGNLLGSVEKRAERYEVLDAAATGFEAARSGGAFAFSAPLARALVASKPQSLLFLDGISATGIVNLQEGGMLHCKGAMGGKLTLQGYTTAVFDGELSGSVLTQSYTNVLVRGALSGSIKTESYSNIYVLGGFTGTMDLYDSAAVYFGGYVPQSALERVKPKGRATFVFEATDLPPGKHSSKAGEVTVLERR
jgi:hypothetical protein